MNILGMQNATFDENHQENERIRVILGVQLTQLLVFCVQSFWYGKSVILLWIECTGGGGGGGGGGGELTHSMCPGGGY